LAPFSKFLHEFSEQLKMMACPLFSSAPIIGGIVDTMVSGATGIVSHLVAFWNARTTIENIPLAILSFFLVAGVILGPRWWRN
jgi:hypothetical protein